MKTIVLAATLAALSMTFAAPMQAASSAPVAMDQSQSATVDRQGRRGCDTPRDIREHPKCTR
jgi:hypothetical protein